MNDVPHGKFHCHCWLEDIVRDCTIATCFLQTKKSFTKPVDVQGHPPELSDSVKLLLFDAKRHGFELDQVLKSID